jgi:hypothetical protein
LDTDTNMWVDTAFTDLGSGESMQVFIAQDDRISKQVPRPKPGAAGGSYAILGT